MKAITESYLRGLFRAGLPESLTLEPGQILTPAAAQYLRDLRISVVKAAAPVSTRPAKTAQAERALPRRLAATDREGRPADKAEHMTHLHGRLLVGKDHPRINLRGMLDGLQADIYLLQKLVKKCPPLVADLDELLGLSRDILRAEVLDQPLAPLALLGLDAAALRERSHHPQRFYGSGHIFCDYRMDRQLLELNRLRTQVRQVELAGIAAFAKGQTIERQDLLQALNRMSSAVYVMMLKWQAGEYR